MRVILDLCVYCERLPAEIVAAGEAETPEEALQYIKIGENQVLLCLSCTEKHVPEAVDDLQELAKGPVTFPPGILAIEHVCPALEKPGEAPQWATITLHLERKDDYNIATCEHCGVTVRSLADVDL